MSEAINIYEMKLHERYDHGEYSILRVAGGWVYITFQLHQVTMTDGRWSENYLPSSVFVPYDNEFQKQKAMDNGEYKNI